MSCDRDICFNNLWNDILCEECPCYQVEQKESEEKNMKEMTVTEYRERLIQAFQNTGNDNLIALVCLPDEDSFKALESLLRNFWNNKGGEEE